MHLQGLGRGFVEKYLSRPNTIVVAAARNPAGEDAKDLVNIPKAEGTKLITVKIDSTSETDAANAIDVYSASAATLVGSNPSTARCMPAACMRRSPSAITALPKPRP